MLVPNERGLDRALALGARRIAVFGSATESFAKANLNRTVDEALAMFAPVVARAKDAGAAGPRLSLDVLRRPLGGPGARRPDRPGLPGACSTWAATS